MVDRQELSRLFRHRNKNKERIQLVLYELAGIITGNKDEDHRQDVWIQLNKKMDRFRFKNSDDPFGYLYQVGLRYYWWLQKRQARWEEGI